MIAHTYTAMASTRIRFGPLVLAMTFRHPAVLARMAAAVDQLSGGRFILGVGAGWNTTEHEAYGIELPPVKQRMDNLEESVRVIKALFENDSASFEGKIYRLKDAYMNPKPAQKPMPLLIGGGGEQRTLRMVARYATEWNAPIGGGLEVFNHKSQVLAQHCEAVKRDPVTIDRSVMTGYIAGENQAEVDRKVQAAIANAPERFRRTDGKPPMTALWGTAPQIIEQIKELEAAGISRIQLQYRTPPARSDLEFVAQELLPKV
jgi:alkanesulfonate monooxygenase SsuD/methylene tetrahydromethanopterin reductase-like flavin-dependent oxidoreductase (luciferase family)